MATITAWLPYLFASRVIRSGSASGAVLRLTLSAPASTAAAASPSSLIPPPTESGMNSSRATAPTVAASARRFSMVAVTSRITSSSMPSSLYRRASAAGSPAERRPSNFTPFTTWPSRTSRQAMMRRASMSASRHGDAVGDATQEVGQDLEPRFAGLLRVELHAHHEAVLDRGRERLAVLGHSRRRAVHGPGIRVREIDARVLFESVEQGSRPGESQRVPPD